MQTRGTETSQYPEEKKSTEIPLVAASERGKAQTAGCVRRGCGTPVWESEGLVELHEKANQRGLESRMRKADTTMADPE